MNHRPYARLSMPGFTLVELLVVIGIIALLISILLPVLGKARESARSLQCQSNMRQFFIADQFYMNRWKGWHLPGWTGGGTSGPPAAFLTNTPANSGIDYWSSIEEVRKTLQIVWLENQSPNAVPWRAYLPKERLCPEAVRGFQDLHTADQQSGWKDMYVNYFYGMNVDGVDYNPANANDPVYNPKKAPQCDVAQDSVPGKMSFHGFRNSQVRRPADKIFFADAMYWWINEWGSGVQPGWGGRISNYDKTGETTHRNFPGGDTERTVAWRHKRRTIANTCFFDGHVEGLSKDRFTVKDPQNAASVIPNYPMWRVMD